MGLREGTRIATVAERQEAGRAARSQLPRTAIAQYAPAADRPDPVQVLAAQETDRVQALLPLRHSRMSVSPFTFYRGSAAVMASDLGAMPSSGLITQLCGDAHLSKFGLFAAPDRSIIFDINDFDETNPGPFEWDVLRLAASFVLAGNDVDLPADVVRASATAVATEYRLSMESYAGMGDLAVWYDRIGVDVLREWARADGVSSSGKRIEKSAAKARTRDSWSAISKMTEVVDGQCRFLNQPPLLLRLNMGDDPTQRITRLLQQYQSTLPRDREQLLGRYHVIDVGHKVVGVGSVGLLAFVLLMQGRDESDLIVMQAKQAVPSVLEQYTAPSSFSQSGERVVVGQQFMQAASDVFLGWVEGAAGRQFYVRQLRDMKFAPDPSTFDAVTLPGYARICGRALARAHARAGDPVAIAAYLGSSDKFDSAVRDFSLAYADQVGRDFAAYQAGIAAHAISLEDDTAASRYSVVLDPTAGIELVDLSRAASSVASTAPSSGTSAST